jgi:hypothetical protein
MKASKINMRDMANKIRPKNDIPTISIKALPSSIYILPSSIYIHGSYICNARKNDNMMHDARNNV